MDGTRKQYDTPTREEVEHLFRRFLEQLQRPSFEGGLSEVPEGDKEELNTLIETLVKYRYAPDSDGDRPLLWSLCDQSREERHHFMNLPREGNHRRLAVAQTNVALAAEDLRIVCSRFRDDCEKEEE